jgi:beta-glucanase (GH16 family)
LTGGYHVYGLAWTPSTITWYFDGAETYQASNTYWHDPQHIIFDLETNIPWAGTPESNLLPAAMSVDYFRMWTMTDVPEPSSLIILAMVAAWRCCRRSGNAKARGHRLSVESLAAALPHGVGE